MTTATTSTDTVATTTDPAAEAAAIWQQLADADAAQSEPSDAATAAIDGSSAVAGTEEVEATVVAQPEGGGQTPNGDIWSTADERQLAAFRAAERRAQELEHDSRSNRGRVTALQRETETLKRQLAALHGAAGSTGQDAGIADADFKRLQDEYPDIARPVLKELSSLRTQLSEAQSRLDRRDSTEAQQRQEQALDREEQALTQAHPDWKDVTGAPAFTQWLGTQPRYVVEAIKRNGEAIQDATEAGDIITRFKAHQGIAGAAPAAATTTTQQPAPAALSAKRQAQLASAAGPAPRGAPKVTTGVPDDPAAAWAYFQEMDRKKAAQTR